MKRRVGMRKSIKPHNKRESQVNGLRGRCRLDTQISIDEARQLLRNDNRVVLVDVRRDGEMCLGHIKGARFVPPGLIEEEADRLSEEKDAPIIVYCSSGDRSLRVVETLRQMGFSNACSIAGGFNEWLKMGFEMVADSQFTVQQLDRYSRNMLLSEIGEEGQIKLMNARVLLVGAGGLASSAGLYLAACGVGTLGIVDFDQVDLSNLNRQVLHGTDDVGRLKQLWWLSIDLLRFQKIILVPQRTISNHAVYND